MKKNEIATAHKKHELRNDGVGRYGIKRQKTKKAVIATNIFVKEMFGWF